MPQGSSGPPTVLGTGFLKEAQDFHAASATAKPPSPRGTGFLDEAKQYKAGTWKPTPKPEDHVETTDPTGPGGQDWARGLAKSFLGAPGAMLEGAKGIPTQMGDLMSGFIGQVEQGAKTAMGAIRATSALTSTPLAYLFSKATGGKETYSQLAGETYKMASDYVTGKATTDDATNKAAKLYEQAVGPFNKRSPSEKATDIGALAILKLGDLVGDPAFESAAVLDIAKNVNEMMTYQKTVDTVFGGEIGQRLTPDEARSFETQLNPNQKIKVTPTKEGPVMVEGYQKRGTTGSGVEKPKRIEGPKAEGTPKPEEPTITRTVPNTPEDVGQAIKEVAHETKPSPGPMPVKVGDIQVKPEIFQMSRRGELRSGLLNKDGVEPMRVLGYMEKGFKPDMVAKDPMKLGRMNFDDPEHGIKKGDVVLISGHHRLDMMKRSGIQEVDPSHYDIKEYDNLGSAVKDSINANTSDFKLTTYDHNLIDMYRHGLVDHTNLLDIVSGDVRRAEQIARIGNFVKKLPDSVWENALIKLSTFKQADEKLVSRKMSALDALAQASERFPEVMSDPSLLRKVNIQVSKIVRASNDSSMGAIERGIERISTAKTLEEVKQSDLFGQLQKVEQKPVEQKPAIQVAKVEPKKPVVESKKTIPEIGKKFGTETPVEKKPAETIKPEDQVKYLHGEMGIPGLQQAVVEDIIPGAKATASRFKDIMKEVTLFVNPRSQVDPKTLDILFKEKGAYHQHLFQIEKTMAEIQKYWDAQPEKDRIDFIVNVQSGNLDAIPPGLKDLAEFYRTRGDAVFDVVNRWKDVPYLENWFPQFWKDPKAADKWLVNTYGRRPFQGPKPFLKKRFYETIQAGIDAGLKPVTTNPEELMQMGERHAAKFDFANRYKEARTAKGEHLRWEYVRRGEKPTPGYAPIDDAIARVYLPPTMEMKEAFDAQLWAGLEKFARDLGIEHERLAKMKGGTWGTARREPIPGESKEVKTRFGGPETVLTHEIGHILDFRYGLEGKLVRNPETARELRSLADLRHPGHWYYQKDVGKDLRKSTTGIYPTPVPSGRKAYYRIGSEKVANLIHAYIHAPELLAEVAPKSLKLLEEIIDANPELKPLKDIKPSVSLSSRTQEVSRGGIIHAGTWHAPEGEARIINNHLSPNEMSKSPLFKTFHEFKNSMNFFELGLSAFHFTAETLMSPMTEFGIGVQELTKGDAGKALWRMASSPFSAIKYYREGSKFFKLSPEVEAMSKLYFAGGAQPEAGLNPYRHSVLENFIKNVKQGKMASAALRAIPAALEATMRPLFQDFIPKIKFGAFQSMMAAEMKLQEEALANGTKSVEQIAREVHSSVDNRFGMIVYDNLFWNQTFKAAMMLTWRSVGWNYGSMAEIGGALGDTAKVAKDAATGKMPEVTSKMGFLIGLVFYAAMGSAIYQKLRTGDGPTEIKDLFYPKDGTLDANGNPNRVALPTYMKDIWQTTHHPILTMSHKLSPFISTMIELLSDKNFQGDYIANKNDNWPTQAKQYFSYLVGQMTPFSVSQYQSQTQQNVPFGTKIQSFFGLSKAPSEVIQSQKQKDIYANLRPLGPRTPEQVEIDNRKAAARQAIRQGDYSLLDQLVREGIISRRGRSRFIKDSMLTGEQRAFKILPKAKKAEIRSTYGQ